MGLYESDYYTVVDRYSSLEGIIYLRCQFKWSVNVPISILLSDLVKISKHFQVSRCKPLFTTTTTPLTQWGRDKLTGMFQTFSNAFSWIEMNKFRLKFRWSWFLRVQSTTSQQWFRKRVGANQTTSHYLNQWWLFSWRICVSRGFNELALVLCVSFLIQDWPSSLVT